MTHMPNSSAELAEIIATADGPLRVEGGGTRSGLGNRVEGEVLSVSGLSGISLYEPGALTIVAGAGTPVQVIEDALASEGQRLPFEPMDHRGLFGTKGVPTIGGVVACAVSGPRRIQAGACRDSLIGVKFVDGKGAQLKNGGRVMKNVTGYDLVKLMCGAYGTLGVLTEVAFKVLPAAEATATVMFDGLTDVQAVEVMSHGLTSPYDVSGAAHLPAGPDGTPVTMIRLEGLSQSVAYRAMSLTEQLARFGQARVETGADACKAIWAGVRDVEGFGGTGGDVWRYSVKPGDGPELGRALARKGALRHAYDWGGGLVWALLPEGSDGRAALDGLGGHATLIRAEDQTKARFGTFHPEPAPLARISSGLRAKFDPKGLLNPGIMG